jgi:16S rRNA C967 or C1407 C5-methylase (RsmB/RsmF family)/NOL1/NOP2/fmu family ribosome biogenesis protein
MQIPAALLASLEGLPGFDREEFLFTHQSQPSVASIRFHPVKSPKETRTSRLEGMFSDRSGGFDVSAIPWCPNALGIKPRPAFTFDPVFHAGGYYVQEAASMFLGYALSYLCHGKSGLKAIDLCAAPGGKSTHLASLPFVSGLLSNEIIRNRVPVLYENIVKWGTPQVFISQDDPSRIGRLSGMFDIMVVDAPCSGSGLFRRDPEAVREWSPRHVDLCSQRQQRILADALPALAEDGVLVYSTCSYSREENEDILDWLVLDMGLESLSIDTPADWPVHPSPSPKSGAIGYRFYPGAGAGEGFFMACLRKSTETGSFFTQQERRSPWSPALPSECSGWLMESERFLFREHTEGWMAIPEDLAVWNQVLSAGLSLRKSGLLLGKVMKGRLNPEHELALSTLLHPDIQGVELSREEAVRYLRKEHFNPEGCTPGWNIVRCDGLALGWLKSMGNRANNYFPMDWRIRSTRPY